MIFIISTHCYDKSPPSLDKCPYEQFLKVGTYAIVWWDILQSNPDLDC